MYKCIVTAYAVLLLRDQEQSLRVTHSHAMVKCLGRKGRGRAVLIPSVYLGWCRPKGTGCLKWFQIIVWGFCVMQQLPVGILQKASCTLWYCTGSKVFCAQCSEVLFLTVMVLQSRYNHFCGTGMDWSSSVPALFRGAFFLTSLQRLFSCFTAPSLSNKNRAFTTGIWNFLSKADISASLSVSSRDSAPVCCRSDLHFPIWGATLPCVDYAKYNLPCTFPC